MKGGHTHLNVAALPVIRIRYHSKAVHAIDVKNLLFAFKLIKASPATGPDRFTHVTPEIFVQVIAIVKIMISRIISLKVPEFPVPSIGARAFIFDSLSMHQTITCIIVCFIIAATYRIRIGRAFLRLQDALSLFVVQFKAGVCNSCEAERHADLVVQTFIIIITPINLGVASVLTPPIAIVCPDT